MKYFKAAVEEEISYDDKFLSICKSKIENVVTKSQPTCEEKIVNNNKKENVVTKRKQASKSQQSPCTSKKAK